jgi:uncharacterized membrane protein
MNTQGILRSRRIDSIDLLRGVVIVIMALDHVRDYFHFDAFMFDPDDFSQTNLALFWTRFITHFCAPVFVFLAGTSAFLVGKKHGKKYLSGWLIKRGLWLILLEVTVIKLAWTFQLDYSFTFLQVIWVLGLSMIVLAGAVHLPRKLLLFSCLLIIISHNLFDSFTPQNTVLQDLWIILHQFGDLNHMKLMVAYPAIPWIAVMPLGYCLGALYVPDVDPQKRRLLLRTLGFSLIGLFFIIRGFNGYGDAYAWEFNGSYSTAFMSFFKVTKYPPSLLFLLITLGPALLFLSISEEWEGALKEKLVVFGRVPMFFYIIHIFVIHLFAVLAVLLSGFDASVMIIDQWVTWQPDLQGYGFSLWVTYLIWIGLIILLYPLCSWYNNYKSANAAQKKWLSYM